MTDSPGRLAEQLTKRFGEAVRSVTVEVSEVTAEVAPENLIEVVTALRDEPDFAFEMLIDLCGVDYAGYGRNEWATESTSSTGFSRGVDARTEGRLRAVPEDLVVERPWAERRFAVVYHLLSYAHNRRLRLRVYAAEDALPVVPSVIGVWNSADWYEREAFDLFGILFDGHPDLRRLLTDYGFIGHPFRKDFPLSGNVEVIYDAEKQRVIYQPVSIDPRVLVPKVIRAAKPAAEIAPDSAEAAE
jgi:NADH-quinone oxidoreductase subunit C